MTTIEDFRRELRNILSSVDKEPQFDENTFQVITHLDKTLRFPKEIYRSYRRAIRILRLKSKNIGKLISDKKLENLLIDFLIDLKYDDEAKVMAEIDKHIIGLFNKLKSMLSQRYLFIVPIMHLFLAQDIIIGDSMLVNLNEQNLTSLESKYSIELKNHPFFGDKDLSQIASYMVKRNETSAFAIVVVEAPDHEKALELAIQKTDTCLNVVRLYFSNAPFVVRDEFGSKFSSELVYFNLDKKAIVVQPAVPHYVGFIPTLSSKVLDEMKRGGFEIIHKLLSKEVDQLTPLQKDMLTAIFWFGNAVKEEKKNMKFIKSVIALETLLVPDGGIGKRDKLSKRFASILYAQTSIDEKKEVFLNMRSLYDIRNSIIHSGEGYIHEDDLNQMLYWTQSTVQFLLTYAGEYNDIFELLEKKFPVDESLYLEL